MRKPTGWRNESQRHSLAARGIRTTIRARGVVPESSSLDQASGYFSDFKSELYYHEGGLATGVRNGDVGSMQHFIGLADEIISLAEDIGLGRERFIKNIRKARNNVERALTDDKFMYKYLKMKRNVIPLWNMYDSKPHSNMAEDDMDKILYDIGSYTDFKNKISNMKLEERIL